MPSLRTALWHASITNWSCVAPFANWWPHTHFGPSQVESRNSQNQMCWCIVSLIEPSSRCNWVTVAAVLLLAALAFGPRFFFLSRFLFFLFARGPQMTRRPRRRERARTHVLKFEEIKRRNEKRKSRAKRLFLSLSLSLSLSLYCAETSTTEGWKTIHRPSTHETTCAHGRPPVVVASTNSSVSLSSISLLFVFGLFEPFLFSLSLSLFLFVIFSFRKSVWHDGGGGGGGGGGTSPSPQR